MASNSNSVEVNGGMFHDLRDSLGMNQAEFWTKAGMTQSGGSRYESGRAMHKTAAAEVIRVHVLKQPTCEAVLRLHGRKIGIGEAKPKKAKSALKPKTKVKAKPKAKPKKKPEAKPVKKRIAKGDAPVIVTITPQDGQGQP